MYMRLPPRSLRYVFVLQKTVAFPSKDAQMRPPGRHLAPPPSLHQSKAPPPSVSFDILFRSRLPAGAPLGSRGGPLSRPMQLRRGRLIFSQTSTQDRGIHQSRCRNMGRQRQKGFSPMVNVGMQHFVLFTYTYENATL